MQKKMEAKEILTHVDHTLLTQTATWEEIRQILDDAMKYDIIISVSAKSGKSDFLIN